MKFSFKRIYDEIRGHMGSFVGNLNARLDRLEKNVASEVKKGTPVEKAVDQVIKKENLANGLLADTKNTMAHMAQAGYNVKPNGVGNSGRELLPEERRNKIADRLANTIWTPDGLPLSNRIHGAGRKIRQDIVDTITASLRNGDTVTGMAQKLYDGYNSGRGVLRYAELPGYLAKMRRFAIAAAHGDKLAVKDLEKAIARAEYQISKLHTKELKASYAQLLKACKNPKLRESLIERAAYVSVQEKSRYHAMRIARTESQRAWFYGMIAKYQDDELVFGYRWVLSSRHKYVPFDQCDVCANMNIGFGKGIYYKNNIPMIPLHPHCMCMLVPMFVTEIDPKARYRPNKAREYIDGLSDAEKQRLFGAEGAKNYKESGDWQKLLRGWNGFGNPHTVLKDKDFETPKRELKTKDYERQGVFDIRAAVGDFKKVLEESTGTKKYVENMKYYADTTEFVLDEKAGPFRYKTNEDVISYNPIHPAFAEYKIESALAHELAHRADVLHYQSFKNAAFVAVVQRSEKKVEENFAQIQEIIGKSKKYNDSMELCDILSALSAGKMQLNYGHEAAYWAKGEEIKALEIFANLSAIDLLENDAKTFMQIVLPELYAAYLEIVE